MSFSQRVLDLMQSKNIPKSRLAREAGIPYTTLDSMLKRDSDGARLELLFRIASILEVSVEELVFGTQKDPSLPPANEEERALIRQYRALDARGKQTVLRLARLEAESLTEASAPHHKIRRVPVYDAPAAAGAALPLLSEDFSLSQQSDIPERASFGIKISGDSMEPLIADASMVWVEKKPSLEDGEIGIFLLNGESLCKKLSLSGGRCRLLSVNPAYAPISVLDTDELKVVGKVLLHGRRSDLESANQ